MIMKYPIRIDKCPIVESRVEVFCEFSVPEVVAIGLIYNALRGVYVGGQISMIQLPVMNIPEEIRKADPNLKNQATNSINCGDEGDVQIGPYGFSFNLRLPYKGWSKHKLFIHKTCTAIFATEVVGNINHVNLRYLDFFDTEIFDKINLKIDFLGRKIRAINPIFKVQILEDSIAHVLQITQGIHIANIDLKLDDNGSLIDLTTTMSEPSRDNLSGELDKCHDSNKHLFFDLLKEEYIQTLNPIY